MKNILVTRIDDRLIHGQVVTAWINTFPITTILIIDDELAENMLLQRIYKGAAPKHVNVSILNFNDAVSYLKDNSENENVMILVKVPEVILKLINNDINIEDVILGGMGAQHGRKTLIRNISASQNEIETMKEIMKVAPIYYQLVPDAKKVNLDRVIKK